MKNNNKEQTLDIIFLSAKFGYFLYVNKNNLISFFVN